MHRSQHRVAIQQLEVAAQLLDAIDTAHALELDGHRAAVGVLGHDVHRPDGRGVFAPHEPITGAQDLDLLGEELLEVSLDPVLGQPRIDAQIRAGVGEDLEDADDEPIIGLGGRDLPPGDDAGLAILIIGVDLAEPGGRTHPVQGLVGASIGMHEDRAVRLDHDEADGPGQVGVEAPGVVHGAAGNDDTHPGSLQGRSGPAHQRRSNGALPAPPPVNAVLTRGLLVMFFVTSTPSNTAPAPGYPPGSRRLRTRTRCATGGSCPDDAAPTSPAPPVRTAWEGWMPPEDWRCSA